MGPEMVSGHWAPSTTQQQRTENKDQGETVVFKDLYRKLYWTSWPLPPPCPSQEVASYSSAVLLLFICSVVADSLSPTWTAASPDFPATLHCLPAFAQTHVH